MTRTGRISLLMIILYFVSLEARPRGKSSQSQRILSFLGFTKAPVGGVVSPELANFGQLFYDSHHDCHFGKNVDHLASVFQPSESKKRFDVRFRSEVRQHQFFSIPDNGDDYEVWFLSKSVLLEVKNGPRNLSFADKEKSSLLRRGEKGSQFMDEIFAYRLLLKQSVDFSLPIEVTTFGTASESSEVYLSLRNTAWSACEESQDVRGFELKFRQRRSAPSRPVFSSNRNRCQLVEEELHFGRLGWSDWILAPSSFKANRCVGLCAFPSFLPQDLTGHALLQATVNSLDPESVPPLSCVPNSYQASTFLYSDGNNAVHLKRFPDMSAQSCGCA